MGILGETSRSLDSVVSGQSVIVVGHPAKERCGAPKVQFHLALDEAVAVASAGARRAEFDRERAFDKATIRVEAGDSIHTLSRWGGQKNTQTNKRCQGRLPDGFTR